MTERAEETQAMNDLAEDLLKVAQHLAPGYGLDPIAASMMLSFAATKGLYRFAKAMGREELAMFSVETMNASAIRSMSDMLAGRDAHPSPQ